MFTIAMPLMYYLIFSSLHAAGAINGVNFSDADMISMAAFGSINAALAGGTRIEAELTAGWLRQIRLTPLGSSAYAVWTAAIGVAATVLLRRLLSTRR